MLSLDEFLARSANKAKMLGSFRAKADKDITVKLTVCIPDIHLLERRADDQFLNEDPENERRFREFLEFMYGLKAAHGNDLEIIQIGDMFDLWKAAGENTNMIEGAYPDILGLLEDELQPVYVVGNHDIALYNMFKSKGETFDRIESCNSSVDGNPRAIFQHGYQADFANNQDSWSGVLGKIVTKVVAMFDNLSPDLEVVLSRDWESVRTCFKRYSEMFSPFRHPDRFNADEYLKYYVGLMEKRNNDGTPDHQDPHDLALAVVGHTHRPRLVQYTASGRTYYLLSFA